MNNTLHLGNNLEILKTIDDNTIDAVVTDPPYGINFLNKKWDYDVPSVEFWKEVLRVLKPGGHTLVFCGTKTQHRMVVNIEDAGFEIRDVITWLYGQGFPHGYNIASGIEGLVTRGNSNTTGFKNLDGKREEKGLGYTKLQKDHNNIPSDYGLDGDYVAEPEYNTEEAQKWAGWNTALKPSCEFITLVRKPISEKNISLNVLKWGVGGINIDATRIELDGEIVPINKLEQWSGFGQKERPDYEQEKNEKGRWPANVILDDVAGNILDIDNPAKNKISRFFYCAKASKKEKNLGMKNIHPTVKPIALMEYLVKMITPEGGICLDPFMGSGTTGIACTNLGINFIGLELDEEYFKIAEARINYYMKG